MYLFKRSSELQSFLASLDTGSQTLGFVPTMGALHAGHLSLLNKSKAQNTYTVCSVFVNPTQFNESTDLDKYPRTPAKDVEQLAKVGCDVLFMPTVEEVYPAGFDKKHDFSFGQLDKGMEGAFRPGHFEGVAQVVSRLLDIVQPDRLYLGQKDLQQLVIVRDMLRQLRSPVELVMVETVRENSGLAMSSRNQRLTPAQRKKAALIYQTLKWASGMMEKTPPAVISKTALQKLSEAGLSPEYFEIIDGYTLQPIADFDGQELIAACTAARIGEVRLIDNIFLKGSFQ